jgi:phosphatidate phosphatase APP1
MKWSSQVFYAETGLDGFFKFDWAADHEIEFGWHEVIVELLDDNDEVITTGNGSFFVPHSTQYGFISDIDDTFLISHSASIFKRMYVLFTHNARSRKTFNDVVYHYQLLSVAHTTVAEPNPFFYVSSSEWNLYDYITEFARINKLPRGIFLLNQVKRWYQIFKTGKTKHSGKFVRIVRILELFPHQRFVLLGDSSQQDPHIYAAIAEKFPGKIHAVYIRDVFEKNSQKVKETLLRLEAAGVACCFFKNSSEAIAHSRKIALLGTEDVKNQIPLSKDLST